MIDQVRSNLTTDSKSDFGVSIAKQVKDHVWGLYGNEHANLQYSIWEKGFKKGKMEGDRALDPAIIEGSIRLWIIIGVNVLTISLIK